MRRQEIVHLLNVVGHIRNGHNELRPATGCPAQVGEIRRGGGRGRRTPTSRRGRTPKTASWLARSVVTTMPLMTMSQSSRVELLGEAVAIDRHEFQPHLQLAGELVREVDVETDEVARAIEVGEWQGVDGVPDSKRASPVDRLHQGPRVCGSGLGRPIAVDDGLDGRVERLHVRDHRARVLACADRTASGRSARRPASPRSAPP